MQEIFLLDTNAYFNLLKYTVLSGKTDDEAEYAEEIRRLKSGRCYISVISQMEIISVVGKYARGVSGGKGKCNSIISEDGKVCENYHFTVGRKPMKTKLTATWLQLIEETMNGKSKVLSITPLPFSEVVLNEARSIVKYSLIHNFGSLDSVIAATMKLENAKGDTKGMTMVTSDKGLKACLKKCELPYWDAFSKSKIAV